MPTKLRGLMRMLYMKICYYYRKSDVIACYYSLFYDREVGERVALQGVWFGEAVQL